VAPLLLRDLPRCPRDKARRRGAELHGSTGCHATEYATSRLEEIPRLYRIDEEQERRRLRCFFVYFAFDGAVRIILAEGPRQAVNAMTLYAVMKADLIPTHGQHANVAQFFLNVKALAEKQEKQAVILFSMLFTLVGEDEITGSEESVAEIQLVLKIEQSLGNCPKYLNSKHIVPTFARPELISDGAQLPQLGLGLGLG
jgi:hypothetical protein